ncbi:IS1096 element passenger TnpR family protein [Actinomadura chokoriensis]|uniref:IS1096 element passenger TnpR family protein n=1 Tax=Actinomadura chokoriensis TaxID=454156 RepID=UPI0031F7A746
MRIHRITITLLDMPVPVWRTVEVPAETTLAGLYPVVQQAMGWDLHGHLHVFETSGGRFGDPDPELEIGDAARVTLDEAAPRFEYLYDFGDGWRHEIAMTETLAADPEARYPRLLDGAGACPPEDSGGPIGYATMLEALADPSHEDHGLYLEWTGGGHDPADFDPAAADRRLRAELLGADEWLAAERIPEAMRVKASGIVAISDEFCLGHLDTAFAELCRTATAKLARKRPSPLARGELRIWAAGIVYAMGRVNFLGDGSHPLHKSAHEISALLEVSKSTMQQKAARVLDVLDIGTFDPEFAHPGLQAHPLHQAGELLRLFSETDPEPVPLDELLDSMVGGIPDELLSEADALDAELFFSEMMGAWWGQELIDADIDEVFCGGLIERAADRRTPQALALLRAFAVLAPPPFAARAAQAANDLSAAGVPDPSWAGTIGTAEPGECWTYCDIYGDQRSIICLFSRDSGRDALCVLIDDSLGRIAKDAYLADQPDLVLSELKAQASTEPAAVLEPIDPAVARALMETAFANTTADAPVSENFGGDRAAALCRIRALPLGGVLEPVPVHDEEARRALVAEFLNDHPDVPAEPVRWIVDHGCDHDLGRPLRVSPAKLDQLLLTPTRFPLEAVLPAWTRWAAARQNLPEEARKALAEIADEHAAAMEP